MLSVFSKNAKSIQRTGTGCGRPYSTRRSWSAGLSSFRWPSSFSPSFLSSPSRDRKENCFILWPSLKPSQWSAPRSSQSRSCPSFARFYWAASFTRNSPIQSCGSCRRSIVLPCGLRLRAITISIAALLFAGAIVLTLGIGKEFMPPLNEGDLMYMPVTDPAISIDEARRITSKQDEILQSFPEVEWAVGKSGRAETSTDPAPVNMNETIVHLKPPELWRLGMTRERLIAEMDEQLRMPGVTNIWTQPIINRIDMLTTGIRSQVGIPLFGNDLQTLADLSRTVAPLVKGVPGAVDVYPEQISGAPYVDIKINRTAAARYGIDVGMIQDTIEKGIGETNLTVTIEGRRRFPVRVRYAPQFRGSPQALGQIPISSPTGAPIPLAQLADIRTVEGPSMISSENGLLRGTVLLNVRGRDVGSFVDQARVALSQQVQLPTGYYISWSGQYENQQRARQRLLIVIPIVLLVIFGLLYITYHSALEAAHVLMAVPFALTGGIYLLWLLGYNFSVAVWVGFIALFGTAVQTGVVMVIYLNEAVERKRQETGRLTRESLKEAVMEGALLRLRPKVMTVSTVVAGLLPIMWSTSAGSEVMKPLATPVLGGMVSSLLHVLIVTPAIFYSIHARRLRKHGPTDATDVSHKRLVDETAEAASSEAQEKEPVLKES